VKLLAGSYLEARLRRVLKRVCVRVQMVSMLSKTLTPGACIEQDKVGTE
jgi:hypothetical protein